MNTLQRDCQIEHIFYEYIGLFIVIKAALQLQFERYEILF